MEHHRIAQSVGPAGFTLLETLLGLAIFSVVVGAVYSGYNAVVDIVTRTQYSSAAVSVIESRVEMVRNMRYVDVGIVNGIPAGILASTEQVTLGAQSFTLATTVRNIDDPFDGTVDGNPRDLNPADYKLVQFDMTCETCANGESLSMVTYLAPKTLEDESRNGSLEISVIDASGQPVPQATVHVTNPAASVDNTWTTNNEGKLLLLSVATGSAAYEITASKTGYSTDQTYPPDDPANALKPHATVATQQLTLQTLVIDRVGTLTIDAQDRFCAATGPFSFDLAGAKLIGTMPDVPKYEESQSVGMSGSLRLTGLEWDVYTVTPADADLMLVGISNPLTFTLDPAATRTFTWVTAPASGSSALISVTDQAGAPLTAATVRVTGTGYDQSQYSGQWSMTDTDWSVCQGCDIGDTIDTSVTGLMTLKSVGGVYATGSAEFLDSRVFDLGTSDVELHMVNWEPESQPSGTSVRMQVAASDNETGPWDYVGPDGTGATFFDAPGQATPAGLNAKRYFRYRVYLETLRKQEAPTVESVSVSFSSACLLDGHATFEELTADVMYAITVTKTGYRAASASFSGPVSWTRVTVPLTPL